MKYKDFYLIVIILVCSIYLFHIINCTDCKKKKFFSSKVGNKKKQSPIPIIDRGTAYVSKIKYIKILF
jgi:uncharacterized alpha/beta hydrolase family protein